MATQTDYIITNKIRINTKFETIFKNDIILPPNWLFTAYTESNSDFVYSISIKIDNYFLLNGWDNKLLDRIRLT